MREKSDVGGRHHQNAFSQRVLSQVHRVEGNSFGGWERGEGMEVSNTDVKEKIN